MTSFLTYLFAGQFFFLSPGTNPELLINPAPPAQKIVHELQLSAKSALVMDVDSGIILFERAAHEKRPIASLTKLMTALLVLEREDMERVVTINEEASGTLGSRMFLLLGEKIKTSDLLRGLLIRSANDAAVALAFSAEGTVDGFVSAMNRRAHFLGFKKTHFANPHGLDDPENYSTAFEIALLGKKLLEYDFVRTTANTRKTVVSDVSGSFSHELTTTNELLGSVFPVYGLKTGTTDEAGQCFIGLVDLDGRESLIVVLGSENRFQDTKSLIWALKNR